MPPSILIVCNDLFFGGQLHSSGKQAGYATKTALSGAQAVNLLLSGAFACVIVDLELPAMNLGDLRIAANAHAGCKIIAFGPHVQTELLEQARSAGCDLVLTRGQISSSLQAILTDSLDKK